MTWTNLKALAAIAVSLGCAGDLPAALPAPALTVTVGGTTQRFTAAQLAARRDAATIEVPRDVSYFRAMRYRAVPLRALLAGTGRDKADTIEFRATDGFVAQIPRALIDGRAVPWLAIEDPAHPWPALPGKRVSAGPFYLVWRGAERGGVSSEQWPYAIVAVTAVASPVQRWPKLAVAATLPPNAAARRGQAVFFANCLSCHRLAGNGEGVAGPDLLAPVPATKRFTDAGLRAQVRHPAAPRAGARARMPAFAPSAIGDADLDALIAYLHHLAARRP
jgi:mono/diheme cytochrome c family protein